MSWIIFWCFSLCFWICGTLGQFGEQCVYNDIREIGERIVFPCLTKNYTDAMTVQLKVNDEFVNVSSCNVLGNCIDYRLPDYTSLYLGLADFGGEKFYLMAVSIDKSKKNENIFKCIYDEQELGLLCFEEFVKPSTPVCQPLALVNSNTQLNVTCTSSKVYPGADMWIKVVKNGEIYLPQDYKVDFINNKSTSAMHPGYYTEKSTALILVSSLEPGTYNFVVWMDPSISNSTLAFEKGSDHSVTGYISLTAPSVRLSGNCSLDGSITPSTCKCELSTPGNPPGQARWYTQSGQVVGTENSEDRSSTLTVSYESEDLAAGYECRAWSELNVSSPGAVSFTPKVAEATEKDQGQDENLILIIALPIAAGVVIIVLIIVIITLCMRKRRRTPAPASSSATAPPKTDHDNHPVTSNPGQNDYIRDPVHHDYDLIITNDQVASNALWSYNNPTFTGTGHNC